MKHIFLAELIKAASLRSIQLTAVLAIAAPPALALVSGLAFDPNATEAAVFPVESHGFETAGFGQPLVILLAALIVGSEYADGQLRTTMLATPARGQVLTAKLTVIVMMSAAIAGIATGAAVIIKHTVLGQHGLPMTMFTPAMGWNLLGVAVNYVLIAVIAAAVTVLVRSIVVALVVLVPLVLGLTLALVPAFSFLKYLPDLAGLQLLTGYPGVGLLEPLPGGLVMAAWALVLSGSAIAVHEGHDVAG